MAETFRRAQLVSPFGVGAIAVQRGGTSIICAGLDHWFEREDGSSDGVVRDEFLVNDPRLRRFLGVDALYQPPDYRTYRGYGSPPPNCNLRTPALRFPRWHICGYCHAMTYVSSTAMGRQYCTQPECQGKRRRIVQARFIAMCRHGHVTDFPWREWAHRSVSPGCEGTLFFRGRGGMALSDLYVSCSCKKAERDLGVIMQIRIEKNSTALTEELDSGDGKFVCRGWRPWLEDETGVCGEAVVGALPGATNVYFATVVSAIYLPAETSDAGVADAIDLLGQPLFAPFVSTAASSKLPEGIVISTMRSMAPAKMQRFTDEQMRMAYRAVAAGEKDGAPGEDPAELKVEEYRVLATEQEREELRVRQLAPASFAESIAGRKFGALFDRVALVEKLRETRALAGFTRIRPESDVKLRERMGMLRRDEEQWLPAYSVFGEGIFLRFRREEILRWEASIGGKGPLADWLKRRIEEMKARGWLSTPPTPAFLLIHTFAHLLINRLTFDCGYGSASLRERLYVADSGEGMSGLLIYTAAGDSEGTLGGLVRMGTPGRLERVINAALAAAQWCAADPVCMEAVLLGGQGPSSCNLAACHNCALVAETSCEAFNRFLDRGVVVGNSHASTNGFFDIDMV